MIENRQKADYSATLDARRDGSLLTPEGLVRNLGRILQELQSQPGNLPQLVALTLIFPEEGYVAEVSKQMDKMNRVIQPRGMMDRIAHAAFRSMSGVSGELKPIRHERDVEDPERQMHLDLNLSGLSRQDLESFSCFLQKNAHRVG